MRKTFVLIVVLVEEYFYTLIIKQLLLLKQSTLWNRRGKYLYRGRSDYMAKLSMVEAKVDRGITF